MSNPNITQLIDNLKPSFNNNMNPAEYMAKGASLSDFKFKNPQSVLGVLRYDIVLEDMLFGYVGE